jgi:hypothetical protein
MYMFDGKLTQLGRSRFDSLKGTIVNENTTSMGIKMTQTEWKEALKGREGLPWYKGSGAKARF